MYFTSAWVSNILNSLTPPNTQNTKTSQRLLVFFCSSLKNDAIIKLFGILFVELLSIVRNTYIFIAMMTKSFPYSSLPVHTSIHEHLHIHNHRVEFYILECISCHTSNGHPDLLSHGNMTKSVGFLLCLKRHVTNEKLNLAKFFKG